jgi:hypothetical protein
MWPVTITDNHMRIGYECYTFEEWSNFSDEETHDMDTDALEFWKVYAPVLLSLANGRLNNAKLQN